VHGNSTAVVELTPSPGHDNPAAEWGGPSLPIATDWRDRATDQRRRLCLKIARACASDAIGIGGTLPPRLIGDRNDATRAAVTPPRRRPDR